MRNFDKPVNKVAPTKIKRKRKKPVRHLRTSKTGKKYWAGKGSSPAKKASGKKSYTMKIEGHAFIHKISYAPEHKLLAMTLGNNVYLYHGVPEIIWDGLSTTHHKGQFFNRYIKNNYKFSKQ